MAFLHGNPLAIEDVAYQMEMSHSSSPGVEAYLDSVCKWELLAPRKPGRAEPDEMSSFRAVLGLGVCAGGK